MNSIVAFLSWYLILTLLGGLTFPLAFRLFPMLADRGYSLSRTAGLLLWGYIFWLFTSLNLTENNKGGICSDCWSWAASAFGPCFPPMAGLKSRIG